MNKLVATLGTTTVLFAASTVYLAFRVSERAATGLAANSPAVDAPVVRDSSSAIPASSSAAAPTSHSVTMPAGSAIVTESGSKPSSARAADHQREAMLPFARDFLRQYDDLSQRELLMKTTRPGIESQYSRLRDRLKLDAAQYSKVVDLLAEEQLESQANYFRCLVNPACDSSTVRPPRDHSDELLALLGDEGYAQFMAYRKAMPEWQSVVQLRGRLSEANYLNDGTAERLMNALSVERERYLTESNQAGVKTNGWGNGTGMLWYAADGGAAEQIASATQYAALMRERAATVLTADQLRAFAALQDEMLAGFASFVRSQTGS